MKPALSRYKLILIATALYSNQAFARDHLLVNNTVDSFLGLQNIEYSYKVADHVAIGLTGIHASQAERNGIKLNGNAIGGIARFYFGRAFEEDAWYASISANKARLEADILAAGTRYTGKSGNSFALGAGYHWFWNSFNLSVGGSLATHSKISLTSASGERYKDEATPHSVIEVKMGGSF